MNSTKKNPGTKPKRVQGAGSIDTLPSGRQRVRFTFKGKTVSEVVDTPEEAEALRRELVRERATMAKEEGPTLPPVPVVETLATWGKRWMQRREARVRWFANDKSRWKLYVEPAPLAALPLADLRAKHLREWLGGLASTKRDGEFLNARTVRHVFNLVRKALADAVEEELIATNPAVGVKVPKRPGAVESAHREFLTADEIRAVLGCESIPEASRLLYAVAIHTGLREGELIALRWGDVREQAARPEVIVRRSHNNAPKNGKVEPVPLLPQARAAFARLRELAREEGGEPGAEELVFPTTRGHQRQPSDDFGWSTRKVRGRPRAGHREIAGVNRAVTFHGLRATAASHFLMGTFGVSLTLAEVRTILRHEEVETTDLYAHLVPGHLHDRIARMAAAPAEGAAAVPATGAPAPSPGVTLEGHDDRPRECHAGVPTLTKPLVSTARGTGVEPVTLGFGGREETTAKQGVSSGRDQPVTDSTAGNGGLEALALEFLRAVDEGQPAGPLARGLALEVLRRSTPDSAPWLRAVDVLEVGALRVRVAVELAGLVLDAAEQERHQQATG